MKKRAAKRQKRQSTVVPPITVGFEEAVSRLLKVKPPPKQQRAKRSVRER